MIETIKNIIANVSDYLNEIKEFIISIGKLFTTFCGFIPSPFNVILLSLLGILIVILVLRSIGK